MGIGREGEAEVQQEEKRGRERSTLQQKISLMAQKIGDGTKQQLRKKARRAGMNTLVSMGIIVCFPLGISECPTRGPSGSHTTEDQVSAVVGKSIKITPKNPGGFYTGGFQ